MPITALRTVLWPISVAKLTAAGLSRRADSAAADVERGAAAVAGDDRGDAHADEVRGRGTIDEVVGVRVDVDESGRHDQPGRVDDLRGLRPREAADRRDPAVLDRDVGERRRRGRCRRSTVPPAIRRS